MTKATGPLYVTHFRRRRDGKTDYAKRLALLKSGKPRLVVRKSNKFILVQIVDFSFEGDKTIASASSRELKKFAFAGKANAASAFLAGLLAGKRALAKGVKEVVLDIGLHPPSKGAVVFAAQLGAAEAGLKSPFSQDKMPSEEKLKGKDAMAFEEAKKKLLNG
ncbi:MAG: 50S ribosomal protein L18 [Candidatus Micrarchaeota archaeon]